MDSHHKGPSNADVTSQTKIIAWLQKYSWYHLWDHLSSLILDTSAYVNVWFNSNFISLSEFSYKYLHQASKHQQQIHVKNRTGPDRFADIHIGIYFPLCLSFLLPTLSHCFFFIMFLFFYPFFSCYFLTCNFFSTTLLLFFLLPFFVLLFFRGKIVPFFPVPFSPSRLLPIFLLLLFLPKIVTFFRLPFFLLLSFRAPKWTGHTIDRPGTDLQRAEFGCLSDHCIRLRWSDVIIKNQRQVCETSRKLRPRLHVGSHNFISYSKNAHCQQLWWNNIVLQRCH